MLHRLKKIVPGLAATLAFAVPGTASAAPADSGPQALTCVHRAGYVTYDSWVSPVGSFSRRGLPQVGTQAQSGTFGMLYATPECTAARGDGPRVAVAASPLSGSSGYWKAQLPGVATELGSRLWLSLRWATGGSETIAVDWVSVTAAGSGDLTGRTSTGAPIKGTARVVSNGPANGQPLGSDRFELVLTFSTTV